DAAPFSRGPQPDRRRPGVGPAPREGSAQVVELLCQALAPQLELLFDLLLRDSIRQAREELDMSGAPKHLLAALAQSLPRVLTDGFEHPEARHVSSRLCQQEVLVRERGQEIECIAVADTVAGADELGRVD